jgi:ribosome-associated protein
MAHQARDVPIRDDSIRLGQFLKFAGLIDSGADAKGAIADGSVRVNGIVETRRGRQLRHGDTIDFGDQSARVTG